MCAASALCTGRHPPKPLGRAQRHGVRTTQSALTFPKLNSVMLNPPLSPTFRLRTPAPPHMCALRTRSCLVQSAGNCLCASKSDSVNAACQATALWEANRFYLKREKATDFGLCKSFSKAKPSYSLGLTSHPVYSPTHLQSLLHRFFSFQLFLLPPELLHFPAAFHALSGSRSHVVVGPFPTQHTSVLAHSARVSSSRQAAHVLAQHWPQQATETL